MNKLRKQRSQAILVCAAALRRALIVSERSSRLALLLGVLLLGASDGMAQTTSFTYQGNLIDNSNPANGQYDFQFKLFDTVTVGTGTQQGTTLQQLNVAVSSGNFTVQLDFGACASCFNGANRFLEIALKPTGGGVLTTLAPRQPISSTPYALKSVNATAADGLSVACLNCITSSQIASVSGSAVSGPIPVASVPAGSANYIQNRTSPQASTNFNIGGDGIIAGNLGIGTNNPASAKLQVSTTALDQHVYLSSAAPSLSLGDSDTRSSATMNSIFALATSEGHYGVPAGSLTIANYGNARGNIYINSNYSGDGLTNVILQPSGGSVGIGTTTPDTNTKLHVDAGNGEGVHVTSADVFSSGVHAVATGGIGVQGESTNGIGVKGVSPQVGVQGASTGGIGVFGLSVNGLAGYFQGKVQIDSVLSLGVLGGGGNTSLCRNSSTLLVSACSSSLRYKTDIQPFSAGLEIIKRLRPISFTWKEGGMRDVGFAAEEVETVEPLLTFRNGRGEVEGVKYDRITVALVNATREQQAQIEEQQQQMKQQQAHINQQQAHINQQQAQFERQQRQMDALKQLVCADRTDAAICKAN